MNIAITGGRLIDPANQLDGLTDLFLAEGKVVAVGEAPAGFVAEHTLDAGGQIVSPGFIDLQAHLREPGLTHKGTIVSETAAAVAGGVTSLCCPPLTQPVLDTPAVARLIRDRAEEAGNARVLPLAALTRGLEGEQLSNMVALRDAGCVAVTNLGQWVSNTQTLIRCCEYAATHNLLLFVRAEEGSLSQGCAHDGATAMRLGLEGISEVAETVEVARFLLVAEETGVRLHFGQLSSQRSAAMVRDAQQRGLAVTADVAVHHLLLCDEDLDGFDSRYHLRPPLRGALDRAGLREALASGTLAALCSDHQPHEAAAKAAPFAATEPGMAGLETLLPLGLRLVEQGVLTLPLLIERLTSGPAGVLGSDRGQLAVGADADICIFDPAASWTLSEASMRSTGRNTPFMGEQLCGRVSYTLVGGRIVFERG
ncbi:dihydroorotase [Motiliproteus sediminis]|uniref:dihydroorotase n=1 Tax=Motiliproteus sediminis TaxID=1468178 RepID=UPI001AEFE253|nr:dihydroorotase [Motiliproteus sediminis]